MNHLNKNIPILYCKCAATFFRPMFVPLFGENIRIEPIKTVLSGAEDCIFRITLDEEEDETSSQSAPVLLTSGDTFILPK